MASAGNESSLVQGRVDADRAKPSVLLLVENHSVPADRRVWGEARSLQRAGYRVSVICPRGRFTDTSSFECKEDVAIHRFQMPFDGKSPWGYVLEYAWGLLACFGLSIRIWRSRGFDVLHVGNPPDFFFPFAWFYKLFGKRFVYDQHDLAPETYWMKFDRGRSRFVHRLLEWCEARSFQAADVIISTNQSYAAVARTRGGVPEDRIFVVRNSPDPSIFHPVDPDPELKEGFPYMVAFVGLMASQDGVDYLLRAAHHVVHEMGRRDIFFALIGTGPAWESLQSLHAELELDGYVRFTGRIPDEPMLRYLSTAEVCASPDPCNALNDVSTMQKLMEYMAMGKPTVSFDLKEARVSADESAVYVPNNDARAFGRAIVELLDDENRRRVMGEAGRRRIQEVLSWAQSEKELHGAYARALRPRTTPGIQKPDESHAHGTRHDLSRLETK